MSLPIDIIVTIANHCKLRDISALRLACKLFSQRITKQVQLTAYRAILERFKRNIEKKILRFVCDIKNGGCVCSGYIVACNSYISANFNSTRNRDIAYDLVVKKAYAKANNACILHNHPLWAIYEILRTVRCFHYRYCEYILEQHKYHNPYLKLIATN